MFELSFEINGKKVSPDSIGDAIEATALQVFRDSITKSVDSIRCPKHGKRAKIIAKGCDIDSLSFTISGCCDVLIERVEEELK